MARKVRDKELDSRHARQKLVARGKPYWRAIEHGLHVGYRRLAGKAGTWCARHYVGKQDYEIESLGVADDLSDADGVAVLNFWQAQQKARDGMVARAHAAEGACGPITVGDAVSGYIEFLRNNRKSAADAQFRANAFILPEFGSIEVSRLTTERIRNWHVRLANSAPRVRTKAGRPQQHRKLKGDDESRRRRRSTANRTLTVLKAALNRAWREGKVSDNTTWRRVEPFKKVDAARIRYLSVAEAQGLIKSAEADFSSLVEGALQTGARYGELSRLLVCDFNADVGTIAVQQSKTNSRHIVLTDEGVEFFKKICSDRPGNDLMFKRANGSPWQKSHQARPMAEACEKAKITPAIGFHGLRHTWASHAVMNGVHMLIVAKNLGHADTRMVEKHYGHLAPSYIADAIRAGAPRFALTSEGVK